MSSKVSPTSTATPSVFDQALDMLAMMHGQPRPANIDSAGNALTRAQQERAARVKREDRPVEPSAVQPDDLLGVAGVARAGLKLAGRKVAEKLAPVAERKAGNWVLNKAEMGLDAFDRALVSKQGEMAAARGARSGAIDPAALRAPKEALTSSGPLDKTR